MSLINFKGGRIMKRSISLFVLVAFLAFQLAGCATMSNTEQGALGGAIAGGLLGAALGDTKGAIIGAAAGAIVGAVIGNYYDKQAASRAEAARKYDYGRRETESRLEIEESSFMPRTVTLGSAGKVQSLVQYTVLAPDAEQKVRIKEIRTIVKGNERIELAEREVIRTQGTFVSEMKFEMPKDIDRGDYTLVTTITDGRHTKTVRDSFRVV